MSTTQAQLELVEEAERERERAAQDDIATEQLPELSEVEEKERTDRLPLLDDGLVKELESQRAEESQDEQLSLDVSCESEESGAATERVGEEQPAD